MLDELEPCIGCGGSFPQMEGPTHAYMLSSPGCWACYGEVLAREYSDIRYWRVHALTVDTYAVQHPGGSDPRAIRSVALHLISLCAVLEEGLALAETVPLRRAAAQRPDAFHRLESPPTMGDMTVRDVREAASPDEHSDAVRAWAKSAWAAWTDHHDRVREWLNACAE